jgi:hypothetical protein
MNSLTPLPLDDDSAEPEATRLTPERRLPDVRPEAARILAEMREDERFLRIEVERETAEFNDSRGTWACCSACGRRWADPTSAASTRRPRPQAVGRWFRRDDGRAPILGPDPLRS